ncbi:hypothetical protein BGZ63DRAFT_220593 [Mariannaea sp. PMI_226]|nr:hypothetical protein BGZ63DRAFT_220593 [Mariannaea sp. PMI_226]
MVTFSIDADNDAGAGSSTPQPRPPLPFAKRAYVPSPLANKRFGTPQSAPSKRFLSNRDGLPPSNLNKSTIASSRNLFRASAISNGSAAHSFSPSLPQSPATKVFAPGATPEPNRVIRASTSQTSSRGLTSKLGDKQLFQMRIEDPDPELSGEVLTNKIPKDWDPKGSIYADQFLAHLCPPEFDDEQRRQFFCILDLRRLKYAANEIFSKKTWKLNVINFAKEFEKSRSIILLRYGLYEFQNVKPSKDVLRRWRREHGLPEPEEEDAEPTPTKPTATKKRKAEGDYTGQAVNKNKRRAADRDEEEDEQEQEQKAPAAVPPPTTNKRKASVSDEAESQPSKMQKAATPSAAKSLFEKIANKSSTPAGSPVKAATKPVEESTTPKANPFTSKTNGANSLARSVFQNLKPSSQSGGNIFGYLSDASSTKNSGVDADAEGETESDDADDSEEPSAPASAAETSSQVDSSNAFGILSAAANTAAAGSSAPGTRESTPGRSLFDRVTKDSTGHPVRMEDKDEEAAPEKPVLKPAFDQTWNPSSTPIKFAPTTSAPTSNPLFGTTTPATTAPSASLFAPKPAAASNIFGAKQDKPAEKAPAAESVADLKDKSGSESDKENDEAPNKSMFEPKAPASQNNAASIFSPKLSTETPKAAEPAKSLFGGSKPAEQPAATSTNLFGTLSKPAESTASSAPLQSSVLFGAKPAEAPKPAATTSLFGASSTPSTSTPSTSTTTNLFGAKPSATTGTNLFGASSSTPAATSLFGASTSGDSSAPKTAAAPVTTSSAAAAAAAPSLFSFQNDANKSNGTSATAQKPMFAVPSSPKPVESAFAGSPMKQDGPSPSKRVFNGGSTSTASSAPMFSFGNTSTTPAAAPIFGASSATTAPASGGSLFGAASSGGGKAFNFSSSGTVNNPFSSGNSGEGNSAGSSPNTSFQFGNNSNSGSSNTATPFQFGSSTTSAPMFGANTAAAPAFGGNQGNNTSSMFGGASGSGTSSPFTFGGGSSAMPAAPKFGSNQAAPAFNLQPPAGGASTGTSKSSLPKRKILPLKRRV